MNFVLPGFLIATAAAAIPLIVHLLNRWQVRKLELGTMRFLSEVIQDGVHRRRIRRWLLLLTRATLMALLALLFARPFLTETAKRDGNRLRIVLIDRSASMGMQGQEGRLLDDAVSAAVDAVSDLGTDATILWAWFDRDVQPMPEDTVRPTPPRAAVGDTNYVAALRWARDRLDAHPQSVADVVMVTDLQKSGLQSRTIDKATLAFPKEIPVRIVDVSRAAASNLAITHVAGTRKRLKSHEPVSVNVTLFNYGSLPFEDISATASAYDGRRTVRLKKTINVGGGEAEELEFDFGKLDPGQWQVTVALDVEDDLAIDNRRFTAVEVADPIRILVVDSGSQDEGESAESYFIVTALHQDNTQETLRADRSLEEAELIRSRFAADVVYLQDEQLQLLDPKAHPLVVIADAGGVTDSILQQLESYVTSGGDLLVFAGDGTHQNAAFWQQAHLAPGKLQTPRRSGVMPFRIASINEDSSMMQPFADPQHADLTRLAFRKMLPVEVSPDTSILAWFDQQRPALTEHQTGSGRVVWFLSSGDSSWSNWTTSPLYLPIVQQMAADLLNLTGEGLIRFRGVGDPSETSLVQSKPNNNGTEFLLTKTHDELAPSEPFVFSQPGFRSEEPALYVINGAAHESDPARMESAVFAEHFGLTVAATLDDSAPSPVIASKRIELWPWLAAAVFVLVIAEFALSNRTTA